MNHDSTTDDRPWTRDEYNQFVAEGVREAEAERKAEDADDDATTLAVEGQVTS